MHQAIQDGAHTAARSDTFEALARFGWVAKGLVHGTIGVLAMLWALGERNGETTDPQGALGAIGGGPLATVLMVLLCAGLVAYALWRFVQAGLDLDDEGSDAKGLAKRAVFAGIGMAYAILAATAISALVGSGDGPDGEADYGRWTAFALALPAGTWLVGAAGVGTIAAGLVQFWRAYRAPFLDDWRKGEDEQVVHQWGAKVSRFGLAARGFVFGLIGWFLLRAGWQNDSGEARNVGESLAELSPEPWLLGIVAAGFIAFGAHCFLQARYRHINGDDED
jgi:hypothetical protein